MQNKKSIYCGCKNDLESYSENILLPNDQHHLHDEQMSMSLNFSLPFVVTF